MTEIEQLQKRAKEIRLKALKMAVEKKVSHIAPSFSPVDVLVALYDKVMKPGDKFILSKGHGCLAWYVLLDEKGLCPSVKCHPDKDPERGIECTTGSLGHGLPIAVGMAFARKYKKQAGRIFVLMGDGECQEGTTWESLNIAKNAKLDNLTIIVDHNKLQALSRIDEVLQDENLAEKFKVFGCNTFAIDGHDFGQLLKTLDANSIKKGMPTAIIANTIKGKGLSFMEGKPEWHSRMPDEKQLEQAYKELGSKEESKNETKGKKK
jgi:transketolase